MSLRVALTLCAAALLCSGPSTFAQKQQPAAPAPARVGMVTRDITPAARRNWRGAPSHTLHTLIWYPAVDTANELAQRIGPPDDAALFEAGSAAPHAAFAPAIEGFPLILLSHGTGGSGLQMAWLGTALARAGFIVAAVDHPGNNAVSGYTPEGFLLWWERATDLSEVLDGLLADPEIGTHIDRTRIGAAGFSLGGYTVLELAGAQTDIAPMFDLCRKQPATAVCHVPEMKSLGKTDDLLEQVRKTSGESLARSADSFRDPRIKAVFAIAPALGFTQTPESLHAIRIPVDLVVGSADTTAPPPQNADLIHAHVRHSREIVLPGVVHYTFLDVCTAAGHQQFPEYCTDPAGIDRAAVHTAVDDMAVQFFDRALRLR